MLYNQITTIKEFADVMKIKSKKLNYQQIAALPSPKHRNPMKPLSLLRGLIRIISTPDLMATRFKYTKKRMELAKNKPCLILMNHSSFIDLEIAYKIFFPRPLCIVSTRDSYIGKRWLMPLIGCIPTHKFVSDVSLLSDIKHALHEKKASVLMFPEAGYSLDGRATALPPKFGMLLKRLGVPVVTVITKGAFLRQPLYNELIKRKVEITADVQCLLTPEEIAEKSVAELDKILEEVFSFDNFKDQYENGTEIDHKQRAKGLQRVLYKCPHCLAEGKMHGEGTVLKCNACGKSYEMTSRGRMEAKNGETEYPHIPDWVDWQRESAKKELENRSYSLTANVEIGIIKDHKALYRVGSGVLTHNDGGFILKGANGAFEFTQPALASHSINADFYFYTMGDIICIGDKETLYYCFTPPEVPVFKARLAAEELYKIKRASRRLSAQE